MLALVTAIATSAYAQLPQVVIGPGIGNQVGYHQTWNRTLFCDSLYILTGQYYVDSLYTLTIQKGTTILGDHLSAGTLIIKRGAQIFAEGTPENPIVFAPRIGPVAVAPHIIQGTRAAGDIGGVMIFGRAPVNKVEPAIEGGIIEGSYGGNDPNDSSGIFKYVRIEYAGFQFGVGNEINSLTMGGVGDGTELHHVQVSYGLDDGFEFFGGTVNATHLIAYGTSDDCFDTDFGNQSKLQFLYAQYDPDQFDTAADAGSRFVESDNDGNNSNDVPKTQTIITNLTGVGPERTNATPINPLHSANWTFYIRENSETSIYNSVGMGMPNGLRITDDSRNRANEGLLQIQNVHIQARILQTATGGCAPAIPDHVHRESNWPCNDPITPGIYNFFETAAFDNVGSSSRMPDDIMLVDLSDLHDPDPRPAPGSELLGEADFSNARLSGCEETTYVGAFDPNQARQWQWDKPWSNYDPADTDYSTRTKVITGIGDTPDAGSLEAENYPNPFNPTTMIRFSVPTAGHVTLQIFNAGGQLVKTLVDESRSAGFQTISWNGTNDSGGVVSSGVYFYQLRSNGEVLTRKMMLLK